MQKLSGLLLIVSGLSLGAYTFLPAQGDNEPTFAEAISVAPGRIKPHERGRVAWVEPAATASVPVSVVRPEAPQAAAVPAMPAHADTALGDSPQLDGWTAIVTAAAGPKPMTSSAPGDAATRAQLTRDLQQSLQRAGCYAGEINGYWTASTKRAMGSFLQRVNATLPLHEPDYILLTLVRSHRGQICGEACPAGQSAGSNGLCIPDAVIAARAANPPKRLAQLAQPEVTRVAAAIEPRSAEAGSRVPPQTAVRDVSGTADGTEQLPWLANSGLSLPVPQPRRVRRPDGMMAVGARGGLDELPYVRGERLPAKPANKRVNVALYGEFGEPAKEAAPIARSKPALQHSKKKSSAGRKTPAPALAATPKQKYIYFAGGRRGGPAPGSPNYNMMQAMGGIY